MFVLNCPTCKHCYLLFKLYEYTVLSLIFSCTVLRANRAMPIVLLVINMCSFYKPTCQQSYANCTLGHSYVFILLSYVPTGLCQFYSWSFICVHFIILRANRAMAAVLLVFHMFLFSYPTCQQGYGSCTLGHSYVFNLLAYVPTGL